MKNRRIASFGTRALSFQVPTDEHQHLQEHIDSLLKTAQCIQHIVVLAMLKEITFEEDATKALIGVEFIMSMATELTEDLREAEGTKS